MGLWVAQAAALDSPTASSELFDFFCAARHLAVDLGTSEVQGQSPKLEGGPRSKTASKATPALDLGLVQGLLDSPGGSSGQFNREFWGV